MATHALLTTGVGSTTAATKIKVGSTLELPAGGPWLIHHIWGQVVKITSVANEGTGGLMHFDAKSGDINPNPAPGTYPLVGTPAGESANFSISSVPLNLLPVDWEAAGKATLDISYTGLLAITTAPVVAAGIIFGKGRPEVLPLTFCDVVSSSFASATEQSIGTITLAEKATRIVGIHADCNKGDAITAAEAILATIRLDSNDEQLPPAQYPCCRAFNASDGTAVGQAGVPQSQFIPVDIPIVGGARINVFATSTASVTGNVDISVAIAYQ